MTALVPPFPVAALAGIWLAGQRGGDERTEHGMSDFKIDDWVRILDVYPHENCGRIATVGRIQENGDVVVYFGDQDEDEWVYASSELEKRPALQLDVDTLTKGVKGPFEPWESDHTALVHVLWAAKRSGLSLDDADEIASRILQSRWAAAYRTQTLQNLRKDHT